MSEWVNLAEAVEILGLPRETIKSKIHNGNIPFRMVGAQFRINAKLAKAYLMREDIANMENIKKEIALTPLSRRKANVKKVVV